MQVFSDLHFYLHRNINYSIFTKDIKYKGK